MSSRFILWAAFTLGMVSGASGQEHRVEVIKESPSVDKVSAEIIAQLAKQGLKIVRGSSRTVCTIWPCEQWEVDPDFERTAGRLYPFEPGELIGLLHFSRRGKDFRDQTISRGWYTLRYGLQPTDGNHVGTSPTRDFLLMVRAEDDPSPDAWETEKLLEASATAAGTSHPGMLCLQRAEDNAKPEPAMRHNASVDWWILHFTGTAVAGDKRSPLPLDVIVAGHADE